MSSADEMKMFSNKSGLFLKVRFHKLSQNAIFSEFENGIIDIQRDMMYVLLNILSIMLLPRVEDMSGYFRMQKASSYHFRFEVN